MADGIVLIVLMVTFLLISTRRILVFRVSSDFFPTQMLPPSLTLEAAPSVATQCHFSPLFSVLKDLGKGSVVSEPWAGAEERTWHCPCLARNMMFELGAENILTLAKAFLY